jgi:hypothetical protein
MTALIWLTVLLKLPIGGLVWMWWVTRSGDGHRDDGGGAKLDADGDSHPHPRWPPLPPRRGPHTGARPPAPPRSRSVIARAEKTADQR